MHVLAFAAGILWFILRMRRRRPVEIIVRVVIEHPPDDRRREPPEPDPVPWVDDELGRIVREHRPTKV